MGVHQLARFAESFSVAEYFWLYVLGLSCAVIVAHGALLKALFSLLLGTGLGAGWSRLL